MGTCLPGQVDPLCSMKVQFSSNRGSRPSQGRSTPSGSIKFSLKQRVSTPPVEVDTFCFNQIFVETDRVDFRWERRPCLFKHIRVGKRGSNPRVRVDVICVNNIIFGTQRSPRVTADSLYLTKFSLELRGRPCHGGVFLFQPNSCLKTRVDLLGGGRPALFS